MRAWALSGVGGRLLVALALTVLGPLGADGAEVWPRETIPRSSIWYAPPESLWDAVFFGEYERLTRGVEPRPVGVEGKRVRTIRIGPDGTEAPAGGPR
jgi:hypothetical protein